MPQLFDYVKSVMTNKTDLSGDLGNYVPFIVNKALSMHRDLVLIANKINQTSELTPDMQYRFFLNSIKPMKRYSKWQKKESDETVLFIQQYYLCNMSKAKSILRLLSQEQLDQMRQEQYKGGNDGGGSVP